MSWSTMVCVIGMAAASASCGPPAVDGTSTSLHSSAAAPTGAGAAAVRGPDGGQSAAAPVNPKTAATRAFMDRIAEYVKFHNNVEKMVPPLNETKDPAKISARERALGEALIARRPDAKPGDFFIEQYQPYLAAIIKEDFAARPLADRRALVQELPKDVVIGVNKIYPSTLPLATFPGNLLKKLPELPEELEYRIVGRSLILRDVTGNVVVDLMQDVFPIAR